MPALHSKRQAVLQIDWPWLRSVVVGWEHSCGRSRQLCCSEAEAEDRSCQYIRYESTFVILAIRGEHHFFEEEANLIRDIRKVPIRYAGYSISYKPGGRNKDGSNDDKWHSHVEIDRDQYLDLRAWFSERALRDSPDKLAKAFYELPIAPYAPVRRQKLMMLREVNRVRKVAGRKQLSHEILPLRRRVIRPFELN